MTRTCDMRREYQEKQRRRVESLEKMSADEREGRWKAVCEAMAGPDGLITHDLYEGWMKEAIEVDFADEFPNDLINETPSCIPGPHQQLFEFARGYLRNESADSEAMRKLGCFMHPMRTAAVAETKTAEPAPVVFMPN